MDYQQLITFIMEMVGTVAFAASGAMVAADRGNGYFWCDRTGSYDSRRWWSYKRCDILESHHRQCSRDPIYTTGSDNYIVCGLSDTCI